MSQPYIDFNVIAGGNRTGYAVADTGYAIVVKNAPKTAFNQSGEQLITVVQEAELGAALEKYAQERNLPLAQPTA